jgi:putative endonuclease
MKFFTYILKSELDGTYYYGHTKDLEGRLKKHNDGKVRSTKSKKPWMLHYYEEYDSKSKAYKRELFFKSIEGYNFLKSENII